MIDTLRANFPVDMTQAADCPPVSTLEHTVQDALEHLADYARGNPVTFGLCAVGVGFILGWKLKPW